LIITPWLIQCDVIPPSYSKLLRHFS
jgi:hypothetical protein